MYISKYIFSKTINSGISHMWEGIEDKVLSSEHRESKSKLTTEKIYNFITI